MITKSGSKSAKIRYKFITSEVPGGYFGSQFNDCYSVSIRSQNAGGQIFDASSMNYLGLQAFDANGATSWYNLELPIHIDGDKLQFDVSVSNIADNLLDSQIIIDKITSNTLHMRLY